MPSFAYAVAAENAVVMLSKGCTRMASQAPNGIAISPYTLSDTGPKNAECVQRTKPVSADGDVRF